MSANWYLIHTKPRQELIAKVNSENQGFETYLPMMKVRKRLRGSPVMKDEAMFPNYIFVSLDAVNDNWYPIRSTRGVLKLVRFGLQPGRVPHQLIDTLQANDLENTADTDIYEFILGDKVRIASGPLAGFEGVFKEKNGTKRALILLEMA